MKGKNIFLLIFLFFGLSFSQWSLTVNMGNPYPSPFLSDWENNVGIVDIRINYTGTLPETVKLIDSLASLERGFIVKGSSPPILFERAREERRDNRDFINYRELTYNQELKEQIIRTGRLFEGTYTLFVTLVRKNTNEVLYPTQQVTFYILAFNQSSLLSPEDNDTIRTANPTFQWTPTTTHPGFEVRYTFRLCEVLTGQSKEVAINNIPHHEEVITNLTIFTYPNTARALQENKEYVWQIQAKDRNNNPIGENEGKSEIFKFLFQTRPIEEFHISDLDLTCPSTISVGSVVRAKVKFNVTGRGNIRGRFLIDGTPWRVFSQYTETSPDSFFSTSLPTGEQDVGSHRLKIEIFEPDTLRDSVNYQVTREGIRLDSLLLIPNVCYLKNFSQPPSSEGENRYLLSGTATMVILSLDRKSVSSCNLTDLKIQLNPSDPFNSPVISGRVERNVGRDEVLFDYKNNFLLVYRVYFEKREGIPIDHILINANLNIPHINVKLYDLTDLMVNANGIVGKGFSTTQQFSKWGVTFSLHDVGAHKAIAVGKTADTLWASLSGDIKLSRNNREEILTSFTNFRITHQGKITGRFAFADPFRLIPGNSYLKLDTINFYDSLNQYYLRFSGKIESLPKPFDTILPRTRFSFLIDMDGRTVGKINPLNEFDRRGAGNDLSEFRIPVIDCTLDLTYLGITLSIVNNDLKLNQSKVEMAMDIYFPFRDDAGNLLPANERRLAIGEMRAGVLEGAITIDFNGNLNWNLPPTIPIIQNKRLDWSDIIRFKLSQLAIQPLPFAFLLNCSLGINIRGVGGGAIMEGFKIYLSGDVEYPTIRGGGFKVLEVFNVSIGTIKWSNRDTTISFEADQTTGEGENRNFQKGRQTIQCRGYFLMEEAQLNIGQGGRIASGGFDRLLVYKPTSGGSKKFTLTGADLSICGMQLLADYDYSNPTGNLRFAGTLNLPTGQGVTCVGKIGNRNGNPSFGLFVAARGLTIPVGPGITLVELGGGFFWYPEEIDIATVRAHCGFTRPEMQNKFQEKRPSSNDPGAFALLFYGGLNVVGTDALVSGKALLTLTSRRFDLDAEVRVLKTADPAVDAKGMCYLSIGWNPAYAEGRVQVDVDVIKVINGEGYFEFYVYSSDAWGIMGGAQLRVLRIAQASTDFFVGNPGFLLETEFDFGIDIYVLSGSVQFDGMVWYKYIQPRSFGGYAGLQASAEILGGLAGANFGLEGAVIGEPVYVIYCVGSLSVEVLWVEVFSGSIWVSIGKDGFDGGTGRNSRYDGIIEDARNLANQMQEEKEQARAAMEEAKNAMYTLSEEQRQKAGATLVEARGLGFLLQRFWYEVVELGLWRNNFGSIPSLIRAQYDSAIFDPIADTLRIMRDTLDRKSVAINNFLPEIESTKAKIDRRFSEYRAILEERLPTIREMGTYGSPLRGKNSQTISISGEDTSFTINLQVGFDIDYAQADRQKNEINNLQRENEAYRQELLRIAKVIDEKLIKLDSLLYISKRNERNHMTLLCSLYYEGYSKVVDYYWYLYSYLIKNQNNAQTKQVFLNRRIGSLPCSTAIFQELQNSVARIDSLRLNSWVFERIRFIYGTLLQKPQSEWPEIPRRVSELRNMWVNLGMELWYNIPKAGYQEIIRTGQERIDTMKAVYRRGISNFSNKWTNFTNSLDRIYNRKADLYELLYDLYDQLELMGDVPTSIPRRFVIYGGIRQAMITRSDQSGLGVRVISRKSELTTYLTNPRITNFSGEYISDRTTPPGSGKLILNWNAYHPIGIADYSFYITRRTGIYLLPFYKSVGLKRNIWLPFISGVEEIGNYEIFLRARAFSGYLIFRRGAFYVNYYQPGLSPQRNPIFLTDTTPPITPVIITDSFTCKTGEIYAKWYSYDRESDIEEYQYSLGYYFFNPATRSYTYNQIIDWTSTGGRTETNIRGLNLRHNETYTLKVKARNGVGLWSLIGERSFKVDTSPPTRPTLFRCEPVRNLNMPYSLRITWLRSEDSESGILCYYVSVGKRPMGEEVIDTTRVSYQPTQFTDLYRRPKILLKNGDTVYITIRAYNKAGLSKIDTAHRIIRFYDNTPPASFNVSQGWSHNTLVFTFDTTYDYESGVIGYQYCLEDNQGNLIINWSPVSEGRTRIYLTSSQMSLLTRGREYIFKVKAINGALLETIAQVRFKY